MFSTAELNVHCFSELEPSLLPRICTVSTYFNFFANENLVWRNSLAKHIGITLPSHVNAKQFYRELCVLKKYYIETWNVDNIVLYFQAIVNDPTEIQRIPCHHSVGINDDEVRTARTEHMPLFIEAAALLGLKEMTAFLIANNHHLAPANPLFYAIGWGQVAIIELLVATGKFDVHSCTSDRLQPSGLKLAPLLFALLCKKYTTAEALLTAGAAFDDRSQIRVYIETEYGTTDNTYSYPVWALCEESPIVQQLLALYPDYSRSLSKAEANNLSHAKVIMRAKLLDVMSERNAARIAVFPLPLQLNL